MKHSKPPLQLLFLRLLLTLDGSESGSGYPRRSSVVSVTCQVGNISNVGYTLQTPRQIRQPQHPRRSKHLKERVATLESHRETGIWAKTRLGIIAGSSCLGEGGERPIDISGFMVSVLSVHRQVRPIPLMPSVSVEVMNLALAEFARDVNPEGKKQIILLLDRAGFHTGKDLEVPEGIELFHLPPYTPELQPAERLWPLLREVVVNKVFATLSALEEAVVKRCQWFSENTKKVQAHVGFQWICKMEKLQITLIWY